MPARSMTANATRELSGITPYDFGEAERRVLATGYPSESYLRALRTPPSPAEIIADAEARHFSD